MGEPPKSWVETVRGIASDEFMPSDVIETTSIGDATREFIRANGTKVRISSASFGFIKRLVEVTKIIGNVGSDTFIDGEEYCYAMFDLPKLDIESRLRGHYGYIYEAWTAIGLVYVEPYFKDRKCVMFTKGNITELPPGC